MTGKILLAAGGTGGHIIPSIAFGQWLERKGESVVWLTGSRELEEKIYQAHGVTPLKISLEGSPLGVRGLRSLRRWKQLVGSFFECRAVLAREKEETPLEHREVQIDLNKVRTGTRGGKGSKRF